MSQAKFKELMNLLPRICALLNNGGGYLLVFNDELMTQGISLSKKDVADIQNYVRDAISYISPQTFSVNEMIETTFLPVEGPTQ